MQEEIRSIGSRIRKHRKALELSQEELGELAGIHPSYVGQLERGIRVPSISILMRIARALGTQPGTLLEKEEPGREGIIQALKEVLKDASDSDAQLILEIARLIVSARKTPSGG